ncbi:hypothetical protein LMG19083_05005 [Ralstonia psammae]|uniref:Uncharacterized protein n=1 Tax=Ralstonia psammae TaxID=3058598 RepID=A0ABM9K0V7_9RALS|nr:hypothetical protein [Ralstonia sp. LMG 19083]CAJ0809718.1 hypothetical protein LMG19083_05005 [Ralstonia sp. LMG 19083]
MPTDQNSALTSEQTAGLDPPWERISKSAARALEYWLDGKSSGETGVAGFKAMEWSLAAEYFDESTKHYSSAAQVARAPTELIADAQARALRVHGLAEEARALRAFEALAFGKAAEHFGESQKAFTAVPQVKEVPAKFLADSEALAQRAGRLAADMKALNAGGMPDKDIGTLKALVQLACSDPQSLAFSTRGLVARYVNQPGAPTSRLIDASMTPPATGKTGTTTAALSSSAVTQDDVMLGLRQGDTRTDAPPTKRARPNPQYPTPHPLVK